MYLFVSAIIFISMAIVLVVSPVQLFSRHDPVMIRLLYSKPEYIKFLKFVGYVFFIIGIYCVFAGIYKLIV